MIESDINNSKVKNSKVIDSQLVDSQSVEDQIVGFQKKCEISPFVKSRIMSQVEEMSIFYERRMRLYLRLAYYCCFAVCVLCSVYLGQTLGDSYPVSAPEEVQSSGLSTFFDEGVESQFILYNNY